MPANKLQRGLDHDDLLRDVRRDRQQIQLAQGYDVRYWCQAFRCSEAQLRSAVRQVGSVVGDVRRYLSSARALLN